MTTAERWRLDEITIRSFRGIDLELTFELGGKPALFCGNNGVGKSTIALALQWTLFGRFPEGVLANSRYRQFLPPVGNKSSSPYGEVSFRRRSEKFVVRRDEGEQAFSVELGSHAWEGEDAETQRDAILGIDMDSFVRTVLLHQTRTRGLLLDEAKSRNHAIDMLLGVEMAQSLYQILNPKPFLDASGEARLELEEEQREYAAQIRILERQLDTATAAGRAAGFDTKDFRWEVLSARYRTLALNTIQFAAKQEVPVQEPIVPETYDLARLFSSNLNKVLSQIQTKASVQTRLASERSHLGRLQTLMERWADVVQDRDAAATAVATAEKQNGNIEELAIQRERLRETVTGAREDLKSLNELYRVLADAHSYITGRDLNICPVCEKPADARHLSIALDRRIRDLGSQEIIAKEKEIKAAEKKILELERAENDILRLRAQLESGQKGVNQLIPQIQAALSLDALPESKVTQRLNTAVSQRKIDCKRLEEQAESVTDRVESLSTELRDLDTNILPVLEKRAELQRHETEAKSAAKNHRRAEQFGQEMEAIGTRLERIRKALLITKERLASRRLALAKPRALAIYKELVRHPRFSTFEIATTSMAKKIDYNFVVSTGGKNTEREARLVLSDGQITATAIGVFLGLAESAGHELDVLFIDDPTQNIDRPCKDAMAKLMTQIAEQKQVILSTHDDGFVSCLEDHGFHRLAAVFSLEKWDGNPSVTSLPTTRS